MNTQALNMFERVIKCSFEDRHKLIEEYVIKFDGVIKEIDIILRDYLATNNEKLLREMVLLYSTLAREPFSAAFNLVSEYFDKGVLSISDVYAFVKNIKYSELESLKNDEREFVEMMILLCEDIEEGYEKFEDNINAFAMIRDFYKIKLG
ncbi:MAG: hypothetical protein HYV97_00440 [Bdellovibrio sp.]|nr:hypothetical protein [Bdellovibrio sp.]